MLSLMLIFAEAPRPRKFLSKLRLVILLPVGRLFSMHMNPSLIQLFHAVVADGPPIDPREVNRVAIRAGYIIKPEACTLRTFQAMQSLKVNYNTTFYKTYAEAASKTREELLADQMLHYLSTYGTNYSAPAFTRNPEPAAMIYKELTPVDAVSPERMFELCCGLLESGAALKAETLETICEYMASFIRESEKANRSATFDISSISNREGRCVLYSKIGVRPDNPVEFLRVAVYACTGSAMLINSPELLTKIRLTARDNYICLRLFGKHFSEAELEGLASIYFRYRHIFIAFKISFRDTAGESPLACAAIKFINYLRHLAPRFKQPFHADVLSRILDPSLSEDDIRKSAATEPSTFRLIRILGYLNMRAAHPTAAMYNIRNGRTYIKSVQQYADNANATAVRKIIVDEIVSRLDVAGKSVRFPRFMELAAPTSEKNFVGNIPFLSSYKPGSPSFFIGIYWRDEWGTHDFDLSGIFPDENIKIGWNSAFTDNDEAVIYSGDMTDADPEAAEVLLFRKGVPDGFIYVNRYFGEEGSKFRLFFGEGEPIEIEKEEKGRDYPGATFSVRTSDIRIEADITSTTTEQLAGYIENGCFHFMALGLGRNIVSHNAHKYPLRAALVAKASSAVSLRGLLLKAGATEIYDSDAAVDIDLTTRKLTRDTILQLFSHAGQ